MKKFLLPVLALIFFTACNNSEDSVSNQNIDYSKLPQEFPFSTMATLNGVAVINGGFGSGGSGGASYQERRILCDYRPWPEYRLSKR